MVAVTIMRGYGNGSGNDHEPKWQVISALQTDAETLILLIFLNYKNKSVMQDWERVKRQKESRLRHQ